MALPFSTNPMTMAENIRKLEDFDGSIPIDKIPKDYSADEVATGQKWVNGKEIYRRVLTGNFTEQTGAFSFVFGVIQNIKLISAYGFITEGAGVISTNIDCHTFGYNKTSGNLYATGIAVTYSLGTYDIIIEYVKEETPASDLNSNRELTTSPDASPEPEAEPVLKKATRKKTTNKEEE